MLLGDTESAEYRKVKEEYGSTIARLEMRFSEITVQKSNSLNIKKLAQDAVNALLELDKLYDLASVPAKRYLVGLLFNEKMTFSDGTCRTGRPNRAAELIYMENKELRAKKMGQKPLKKSLPHKGWKMGLEPTTLGTTNRCSNQLSYIHRVFECHKSTTLYIQCKYFFL